MGNRVMISTLWPAFGLAANVLARPTQHGSGVDDAVCLVLPMVILGVVFLLAMRKRDVGEPDDEVSETDAGEPDESVERADQVDREP
jgi:hypothetical protein